MRNAFALLLLSTISASVANAGSGQIERGAYLARVMDCAGCHMPRDGKGVPIEKAGLSGGNIGFEIPGLGIFWPPNLTPDESGLGGWSKADIIKTLRTGVRPDGRGLAPAMPWPSYAGLNDKDMDALATYLMSMKPVRTERLAPVADAKEARSPFYRVTLPGPSSN